jgi:hypothetical protein
VAKHGEVLDPDVPLRSAIGLETAMARTLEPLCAYGWSIDNVSEGVLDEVSDPSIEEIRDYIPWNFLRKANGNVSGRPPRG